MSYNKRTWSNGNVVGAVDLNRIENGIADIDVDEIRGWGVETTTSQLLSETVTTTVDPDFPEDGALGALAYSTLITADTLTVTFNGTDYVCPRIINGNGSVYGGYSGGAPDFTDYPFAIYSSEFMGSINTNITTASAGTYAVSASSTSSAIEISDQFRTVVGNCVDTSTMPMLCVSGTTTYADMNTAFGQGKLLFFRPYSNIRANYIIVGFTSGVATFLPENSAVSATFENDVFTVTIHT